MELFWSEERLDWETIVFVSRILKQHHKPLRTRYDIRATRVGQLDRRFVTPVGIIGRDDDSVEASFVYQLHRSRQKKATDPRDRVFANLGHFSSAILREASPPFEADYTRSTVDIYTDVAILMLRGYPTLELLNAVQHFNGTA